MPIAKAFGGAKCFATPESASSLGASGGSVSARRGGEGGALQRGAAQEATTASGAEPSSAAACVPAKLWVIGRPPETSVIDEDSPFKPTAAATGARVPRRKTRRPPAAAAGAAAGMVVGASAGRTAGSSEGGGRGEGSAAPCDEDEERWGALGLGWSAAVFPMLACSCGGGAATSLFAPTIAAAAAGTAAGGARTRTLATPSPSAGLVVGGANGALTLGVQLEMPAVADAEGAEAIEVPEMAACGLCFTTTAVWTAVAAFAAGDDKEAGTG